MEVLLSPKCWIAVVVLSRTREVSEGWARESHKEFVGRSPQQRQRDCLKRGAIG